MLLVTPLPICDQRFRVLVVPPDDPLTLNVGVRIEQQRDDRALVAFRIKAPTKLLLHLQCLRTKATIVRI